MIVQCDNCKTKFNIADAKVSDSGVKVRCSRCSHAFVVKRDASGAMAALTGSQIPMAPAFAAPLPSLNPTMGSLPSFPEFGSPTEANQVPTQVMAQPAAYAIPSFLPPDPGVALGFAPPPSNFNTQSGFGPSGFTPPTGLVMQPGFAPFATQTAQGAQHGYAPPMFAPPPFAPPPFAPPPFAPPPFGQTGATSVSPAPRQDRFSDDPALGGLLLEQLFDQSTPDEPIPEPLLEAPRPRVPETPRAAVSHDDEEADRFGSIDLEQLPTRAMALSSSQVMPARSSDLGDIPGLLGTSAASEDPFAALDLDATRGSGFDLGEPETENPTLAESVISPAVNEPLPRSSSLARIDLGRAGDGLGSALNLAATRVASSVYAKPKLVTREEIEVDSKPRWPTLAGLIIGALISVLGVVGHGEGDIAQFGLDDLVGVFSRPQVSDAPDQVPQVEGRRGIVSAYTGKDGKRLLVVTGEAYNSGPEGLSAVEAVVSIGDGEAVLVERAGRVGVRLEEEQLASLGSDADLRAAWSNTSPPVDAPAFESGVSLPFMVVFVDPPTDLEMRRFHVSFRQAR